jgi:hypothetical protein
MPALENERWEIYAQGLASGLSQGRAYIAAGYFPSAASASRLSRNVKVLDRVSELKQRSADRVALSKCYVLEAVVENLEKALGRRPVRVTSRQKVGEEYQNVQSNVFLYRGDVANAALKLLGAELGLFTDRKEAGIRSDYDNMSDEELARRMQESARLLLEGHSAETG